MTVRKIEATHVALCHGLGCSAAVEVELLRAPGADPLDPFPLSARLAIMAWARLTRGWRPVLRWADGEIVPTDHPAPVGTHVHLLCSRHERDGCAPGCLERQDLWRALSPTRAPAPPPTRVVTVRSGKPYDVYVGRAGKGEDGYFGNPFAFSQHGHMALSYFRRYFLRRVEVDRDFRLRVLDLRGKVLGCPGPTCDDGPCHGKIMAEWLDKQVDT